MKKSLKPVLLLAMISGIFQGYVVICITIAFVKQDGFWVFVAGISAIFALFTWGFAYDRAVELRDWINPEKETEFKNEIPSDAVDAKWIKEIEDAYDVYVYLYVYPGWSNDPLTEAKQFIACQQKDISIRNLISAAKTAIGIRLPK